METVNIVNMTEICRLCLSEEGVGVPIFGGADDATQGGTPLSTRIMTCASLEVHAGDGLPPLICLRCQYQVDQAYKFRVQCQRSDATLRRHFNLKPSDHHHHHHHHNRRGTHQPLHGASQTQGQQQAIPSSHQPQHQAQGPLSLTHHQHHQVHQQVQAQQSALSSSHSQRVRNKRTTPVRANPPVEVEMLNVESEHSNRVAAREMVAEETSSSSHLSPGTEHPVHSKDHCVSNFLAKRGNWSESQEPEVVPTAGAAVAYQQQVSLMKQEASEADGDDDHSSKNKSFNQGGNQGPSSREEHLLNELNSLGATALSKSPNNCLATAMYNLKALTGEHQFSCDICGRSFVQNHSLTRHMRTHTGERPYPCSTCGKAFIQNHSLTRHMRTHTGERPFSCTTCGRAFAEHHKLKSHCKIHTGERPYPCETCGKAFIERHTLLDHMKLHTGERNYSCAICGKSFMERHKLKRHLRSHTGERPYSCGTCGKSFVQSHNLTQHMRIHTGEQPYPCSTCGKMFGERHKLERHLRSHSKNGPYACPSCGKRFVQSHRLARHVRLHAADAQANHNQGPPNVQSSQQPPSNSQQPPQEPSIPRPHPQQPADGHSPPPQQPVVQLLHHPLVLPIPLPVRSHFMKDMT